jgi:hypothetical protein
MKVAHFLSFFLSFFLCGLLGELSAYTLSHSISPYLVFFFQIGSPEVFAWADFELRSS